MPLGEPRFCTDLVFPEDVFLFVLGGYSAEHPVIKVFWRVVEGFTDEEKRKLLKFVTSCSRPPLLGFKVPKLGAQRWGVGWGGSRGQVSQGAHVVFREQWLLQRSQHQAVTFHCVYSLINPMFQLGH